MATSTTEPTRAEQLLALLTEADAADLAALDQKIQGMRQELAGWEAVRKLLDLRLNGQKPRASPTKKNGPLPSSGTTDQRRRAAVKLLASGPRPPMDVARECGIPAGSITAVLDHPWFSKSAQGVHITSLARQEVL